ncbi:MAG: hypothetical protein HQK83_18695 [Fibrobacteria bacterium]|nr:hypothetical protein [Fibrobacteria bacterium]
MIELSAQLTKQIQELVENAKDLRLKNQINSGFWNALQGFIKQKIDSGNVQQVVLSQDESFFFDFGVLSLDLIHGEYNNKEKLLDLKASEVPSDYFHFIEWFNRQYEIILKNDQKSEIKKQIKIQKKRLKALENEIGLLQSNREHTFSEEYERALRVRKQFNPGIIQRSAMQMQKVRETDILFREVERTKKMVTTGTFLNPEQKREFIASQDKLEKARTGIENLIGGLGDAEPINEIRDINKHIESCIIDVLNQEREIEKSRIILRDVSEAMSRLTPSEIENAVNRFISYNRDLVKICAKRKRAEPFAVLNGNVEPMSLAKINEIMKTVMEFDPKLFKNDRIRIIGRPSIVIVPGYGDGSYDWKYNALVIPTMPYRTHPASVFSAVVEYKLDCDEDKILLSSYNKLKEYADIRSTFQLKDKFIKDYIAFMGNETKGYKVLPKNIRKWFEREVAPNKHNIRVPLKFDPLLMSREEFEALKKNISKKIEDGKASSMEYFIMGIIYEYCAEDYKALNCFIKAVIGDNNFLTSIYNAGIMAIRVKEKKIANKFFSHYMKLEPQSWWSAACRDHLIKLR